MVVVSLGKWVALAVPFRPTVALACTVLCLRVIQVRVIFSCVTGQIAEIVFGSCHAVLGNDPVLSRQQQQCPGLQL